MKTTFLKAGIVILVAFFSIQFHTILGSYAKTQVLLNATANQDLTLPPIIQGTDTRLR